jgi:hypothetical protein
MFKLQREPLAQKDNMTQKRFWCGILIVVLIVGLAKPARADKLTAGVAGIIVAIVVVGVALAFVVPATIIHYTKKRTITGCVSLGANGMSVTDERDKQIYTLSGETTAIRPGDRMKLRGRKVRSTGPDKARLWEAKEVLKNFGVCQP